MSEEHKGLQTQNLPWLTRVLVHAIFDSLSEERKALQEMNAPAIDSFINWDGILAFTYARKKVRLIAKFLQGEKVEPNAVEYEIAYLRNREPLRVRVSRLSLADLIIKASEREGEEGGR